MAILNASPLTVPSRPIPLRRADGVHGVPDQFDGERISLVRGRWSSQDASLIQRDKTIEENIRMLSGRQWDVWSDLLGQFIDVTRYMTDSERRWRQRPVVNVLQYWYMLTHARLTENPPVIAFQPSTADRKDAMLAEAMDTIFKTLWVEIGMDPVITKFMAWLAVAGESYLWSRADMSKGDTRPKMGHAKLSMQAQDGSTIERYTAEPVPHDAQGNPLAELNEDGSGYSVTGEPATEHEGELTVNVVSPLEIRCQWGNGIAWTDKQWIIHRTYLTPVEVESLYGVTVNPDVSGNQLSGGSPGYLQRMLFGSGYFGAVMNGPQSGSNPIDGEGYVTVDMMWEKPSENSPETDDSPGGRFLVVCPTLVLHDSVRPGKFKAAGPYRKAVFVELPGRASGSTPLEQMVPIQKTYNRGWAQILEHRNLCTNPILVVDEGQGEFGDEMTNLPGSRISANFAASGGKIPAAYLVPPPLSGDVWKIQQMLLDMLMRLGSIEGAEGAPPTDDPSGELVSQLRFNSDRFISPATRSAVTAIAGMAEDWAIILPTIWTDEKIITYAGEDSVVRTMTVLPEMWEGECNVKPDVNSMKPESQGEKRQRITQMWQMGAFGNILDPNEAPQARATYLQLVGFPDMNRATRPGGVDVITAQQNLGKLVQGTPAAELPLLQQYDFNQFKKVTRDFIASPEYLSLDPAIQNEVQTYWEQISGAQIAQAAQQMQQQAPLQMAGAAMQGTLAHVATIHGPPPPEPANGKQGSTNAPDSPAKKPGKQAA